MRDGGSSVKNGLQSSRQADQKKMINDNDKANWRDLLKQAIDLHQRGVAGDQKACQKAYSLLLKIKSMTARESIVEAYLGSTMVLLGRDEKNPEEKVRKVLEGLKILDRVVASDGNNMDIRILRAYVCFHLPDDVFHRMSTAISDFNYLIKRYQRDPSIFTAKQYNQLARDLKAAQSR